jgi:uncharacterized Zn-binding protein involved in type VI secretion
MSVMIDSLRQSVHSSIAATTQTVESTLKPATDLVKDVADGKLPSNPIAAVKKVSAAIKAVKALPMQLLETGLALLTNPIAAILPSFPAAQLGSLYVGVPHAHMHPPSLVPPAPPVPLPSMGPITLGTCVKVLIGGMPAARVGDLGMAPTCGGIAPFFTVFMGSSKVFIGGARAARQTDMCTACTTSTATAMSKVAIAAGIAGMVMDLAESSAESNAALAAAQALGVGMAAAQMAADVAAQAISKAMGTDPAVPPALPGFIMMGAPTVLVAGVPMPATADVAKWLKNKLKGLKYVLTGKADGKAGKGASKGGGGGCPG